MPKNPLISVIIPVYNVAATLRRCIDSVMHQTYPALELILVDDGSTDGSGELCDQIAERESTPERRIHVIHQSNQGLSAARNTGLQHATGQLISFLDSDDALDPQTLSQLYQALEQTGAKLAACDFQAIKPHQQPVLMPSASAKPLVYSQSDCLVHLLLERNFPMMVCGKLYHRALFDQVQFPVGKLYEDVGTTYRLVLQCPTVAYLPQQFYHYYQNPDSIIHRRFSPAKLDLIELTDRMCTEIFQALDVKEGTQLAFALKNRRMHARFSILRQLVLAPNLSSSDRKIEAELTAYLKNHRADILENPLSSRRDRLAMRSLLLGLPAFKLAWRTYQHFAR